MDTTEDFSPVDLKLEEISDSGLGSKLNWLRAGVLGANDGIVSIAGIVMGVSGAAVSSHALLVSGIAGIAAGALSMAAGEYVSVSTQRDAERAAIAKQRELIEKDPVTAERRLAQLVAGQGISKFTALRVAHELTKDDPVSAHAHYEFGIDPDELTNPWHAAWASMVSFIAGAFIPFLAILLSPTSIAIPLTAVAVTIALALTGSVSAKLGAAPVIPATLRNIIWGNVAMFVTYFIGTLFGGGAA